MAGLEDLLGSILGGGASGGSPAAAPARQGGGSGLPMGLDPETLTRHTQQLNKVMMVVGPMIAMFAANGGLQKLMGQLTGAGHGAQANSWVSTGENQPISGGDLQAAMPEEVAQLSQQTGMAPQEISDAMSQLLPGLVDKLTPSGALPDSSQIDAVLSQIPGGDQLKGLLAGLG